MLGLGKMVSHIAARQTEKVSLVGKYGDTSCHSDCRQQGNRPQLLTRLESPHVECDTIILAKTKSFLN